MDTEKLKEILVELDGIALQKIHYITNMTQQKQIIMDNINDPKHLKTAIRVYSRYEVDCLERIRRLEEKELKIYVELSKL